MSARNRASTTQVVGECSPRIRAALTTIDREDLKARILAGSTLDKSTGCRIWNRGHTSHGYGQLYINSIGVGVHRASFYAWNGYLPPVVRHRCDRSLCCSANCLQPGTAKDNVQDMFDRGRNPSFKGERNGRAKLTSADVQTIHELLALGELNQRQIADRFGVNKTAVSKIFTGHRWPHTKKTG